LSRSGQGEEDYQSGETFEETDHSSRFPLGIAITHEESTLGFLSLFELFDAAPSAGCPGDAVHNRPGKAQWISQAKKQQRESPPLLFQIYERGIKLPLR
jgi:hypothetical protein